MSTRMTGRGEGVKGFLLGAAVTLLAGALAAPVLAETADVAFNTLNIKVNGVQVASVGESFVRDNGAEVPYSIAYKGTTYLPLAKLAEALGAEARWDAPSSSALITMNAQNAEPEAYPGTAYKTFTEVTGTPQKTYFNSDGMAVYIYELVAAETDNALQYITYLMEEGFALYDTDTTANDHSITYMLVKDMDVFFITSDFLNDEVWVSPLKG